MIFTDDKSRIEVLRAALDEIEKISHGYLMRNWQRVNDIAKDALKMTQPLDEQQQPIH